MMSTRRELVFLAVSWLLVALVAGGSDADICGGAVGQVCMGCNKVAVCVVLDGVNPVALANMSCPLSTPFCSGGQCVSRMDIKNPCGIEPTASSTFVCPDGFTGYLPEPTDCSRYHYCVDGQGWDYSCNVYPNTVYDHASAGCVPHWSAPCFTVKCPAGNKSYSLYAADNTIAFRCGGKGAATVLTCPANHRLDIKGSAGVATTPSCVRFCPREGRQAANDDPTSKPYYECFQRENGGLGDPVLRTCPDDTFFDVASERCRSLPGVEEQFD